MQWRSDLRARGGLLAEKLRHAWTRLWPASAASHAGGSAHAQQPGFVLWKQLVDGYPEAAFVIGPQGDGQLVNYRFRAPYYVVDRLFGAAELRLGGGKGAKGEVVRIERTDGVPRASGGSVGGSGS